MSALPAPDPGRQRPETDRAGEGAGRGAPAAADRSGLWGSLQAALAAARARLAAGAPVGLEPLERGLQAFAEAERRPPAGPAEEAALVALLDELESLAVELAAERDRLRDELRRLGRASEARRGYAASTAG